MTRTAKRLALAAITGILATVTAIGMYTATDQFTCQSEDSPNCVRVDLGLDGHGDRPSIQINGADSTLFVWTAGR